MRCSGSFSSFPTHLLRGRTRAYLALGCLRGFTLIPATYLVVAGMLVLPPLPLFVLTVAGIIVSSTAVYYFAEAMRFDRFFERRYAPQVARLRELIAAARAAHRHRLELLSHRAHRPGLLRLRSAEGGPEEVPAGGHRRRGGHLRDLYLCGWAGAGLVALTFPADEA